jgi:hypothetical protein
MNKIVFEKVVVDDLFQGKHLWPYPSSLLSLTIEKPSNAQIFT